MTHQDNKWGFLCDQHLSSEFLFVSAVFGNLSEIPPSKNDCTEFAVSHKWFIYLFIFPEYWYLFHLKPLAIERGKWGNQSVIRDLTNCPF